jgi:hypothetical protein
MITLSILSIIWGIVSYIRIKKICDQKNEEFNPFAGSFFDYFGIVIGAATSVITILTLAIRFLP